VGEERKDGTCDEAAKGAPAREGTSMSCKGKGAGRRKKAEKGRGRRSGAHGQTTRSTARVEKELNRKAKKKAKEHCEEDVPEEMQLLELG